MDTPPFLSLLEDADAARARAAAALLDDWQQVGQGVTRAAERMLPKLDLAPDGTVRATRGTLRAWATVRSRAAAAVGEGTPYATAVDRLLTELRTPSRLTAQYLESVTGQALPPAAKEAARYVEGALRERLMASGPAAVSEQLTRAVPTVVGKRPDEIAAAIRRRFVDEQALPARLGTDVTDATESASRQYLQTVSADLGLGHYFYKGTLITDSRAFCQSRTGKYFTQAEVEGWAALTWDGKNPATDAATIYTLLGGYRCRHRLVPVTKAVYEARTGRAPAPPTTPLTPPTPAWAQKEGLQRPPEFFQAIGNVSLRDAASEGKPAMSYYRGREHAIYMGDSWGARAWTATTRRRVLSHETGHAFHDHSGLLTYDRVTFVQKIDPAVEDLYQQLATSVKKKVPTATKRHLTKSSAIDLYEEFRDDYENMDSFLYDLSTTNDLLGVLTKGTHGWGHDKSTYKRPYSCRAEMLAHAVDLFYEDNVVLKRYLPTVHSGLRTFMAPRLPK